MAHVSIVEKTRTAYEALRGDFGYSNSLQAPRLTKVVISTGVGSLKDKNRSVLIQDRLAKITGQKPAPRAAKKSIATFKTREGDVIGFQATLRGARMRAFLEKLLSVALPRTRDFRGIPRGAVDAMGNYTLGIREHTIFPEAADEELRDVFGFAVTIVTTARNPREALAFFKHLGFPFAG